MEDEICYKDACTSRQVERSFLKSDRGPWGLVSGRLRLTLFPATKSGTAILDSVMIAENILGASPLICSQLELPLEVLLSLHIAIATVFVLRFCLSE